MCMFYKKYNTKKLAVYVISKMVLVSSRLLVVRLWESKVVWGQCSYPMLFEASVLKVSELKLSF